VRELSFSRERRRYLFPVSIFRPGGADMTAFAATALLDTGATASGIGPSVIAALRLRSHMKKRLLSATEEVFADYYLFRVGFYTSEQLANVTEAVQAWPFLFDEVEGFSWSRPGDFDVIVGMDILSGCDVALSRNGRCRLEFG
jgi:hypothetical protein